MICHFFRQKCDQNMINIKGALNLNFRRKKLDFVSIPKKPVAFLTAFLQGLVLLAMVFMTNRWWSFHTDFNQSKKIALIATMSDWIKLMLHDSFNQIWAKIYHWFLWHFQTLTLIRVSKEKEEGQGLREFKNLGNYFSVPTAANLWNYFSRHEQHHKRERNQIRRLFASNTFIFNMFQLNLWLSYFHIRQIKINENKFISLIQIYHGFNF